MRSLAEGEKDLRPFVPTDFNLPGFERKDIIVASEQTCVFLSTSGHKIGQREIQKQMLVVREIGELEVRVEAGIDAGGRWESGRRLTKVYGDIDCHLPWVQEVVVELGEMGYFDELINEMQKEYERGQNFVGELIPAFLSRFPEYDLVINRFEKYKDVMFVGGKVQQRAVRWYIGSGEFTISVGETKKVLPSEEVDFCDFTVNGERYWAHDFVAVWYPTEDRDIAYNIDDTDRRTELLHLSFDTLDNFLERYYK